MESKTVKDIRIEIIVEKIREYQCRDFKQWYYYRSVLNSLDPHHPQLELGFHGLPYFGHRVD